MFEKLFEVKNPCPCLPALANSTVESCYTIILHSGEVSIPIKHSALLCFIPLSTSLLVQIACTALPYLVELSGKVTLSLLPYQAIKNNNKEGKPPEQK